jgi:hypothetical protein
MWNNVGNRCTKPRAVLVMICQPPNLGCVPVRYLIPSSGPLDWQPLLAEPEKHWVRGRSAWETAHSWEAASGFPPAVRRVLDSSPIPELQELEPLVGFPEWETPLPGGDRASQTDLLVLARGSRGLVVFAVEAKVDESFGPLVSEWAPESTSGRSVRFRHLIDRLGLDPQVAVNLRYQLIHRTAAAIIEAERFGAVAAVMLVHSFSPDHAGVSDYVAFAAALGGAASPDAVTPIGSGRFLAWVSDLPAL